MGEINLPREEQEALAALDLAEIDRLIDRAVQYESSAGLDQALWRCGPFVAQKLRYFDKALDAHRKAKAAKKREQTAYDLRKEASELKWAIGAMRDRMEIERRNGEIFYVDDQIFRPQTFTPAMRIRVAYRWRRSIEDNWSHGAITFRHQVDTRPNYLLPQPPRKLSPAKQREALQESLAIDWQHLMRLSLWSVRDYFLAGHDGSEIPETFDVIPDSYSRGLNNHSCDFWNRRDRP